MAWDGQPGGWRPPAEQKAAAEAAAKFEAERAAADARTQTVADAIAFGFDRLALAIVAVGGDAAVALFARLNEPGEPDDMVTQRPIPDTATDNAPNYEPGQDPDMDDLLSSEDGSNPYG